MFKEVLYSKLHRATVTESNLNYEGSIGIDSNLLSISGIIQFDKVEIYNITNGERFSTYVIALPENSKSISINGAGARLVQPGDKIIICKYIFIQHAFLDDKNDMAHIILLDDKNEIIK